MQKLNTTDTKIKKIMTANNGAAKNVTVLDILDKLVFMK